MTQPKPIGQQLREIREAAGLPAAEVARRCDPPTHTANVLRVEEDRSGTTIQLARRIAVALGYDLAIIAREKSMSQLIGWVEKLPNGDLRYCEQMAEIDDEEGVTGTSGAYCLDDYDRESCEEFLGKGVTINGINPYHSDAIVVASFVCE